MSKVENYLRSKFGNQDIRLVGAKTDPSMAEVYIGSEFVGTLYRDEDDGDVSFDFNMSILAEDLDI